jgi:hypothetical protein
MDILNWLYLKTQGLVRTQVNDAKTDLVTLGAEVPFTTRGDGYQAYAMPLADAVHAGCVENNTLKTGIYDDFPWIITPVMLPTCTRVEDTPAFPTAFAANLVGYKVQGSYDLNENDTVVVEYIGTVENVDGNNLFELPWKTAGSVGAFVNVPFPNPFVSAFANGATIQDDNGDAVPAELMTIAIDFYAPGAADLYLVIASNTAVDAMYAAVSFEFEFLEIEGETLKFTIY